MDKFQDATSYIESLKMPANIYLAHEEKRAVPDDKSDEHADHMKKVQEAADSEIRIVKNLFGTITTGTQVNAAMYAAKSGLVAAYKEARLPLDRGETHERKALDFVEGILAELRTHTAQQQGRKAGRKKA